MDEYSNNDIISVDVSDNVNTIPTETYKRSIVKAVVWRVICIIQTIIVAYCLFDDIEIATKMGIVDNAIKFVIHYIYERLFSKISWGYEMKTISNNIK
tara:strand:- start:265 stop:558 length:294 start_codon:yes stop_codon:yes gene_type:complete